MEILERLSTAESAALITGLSTALAALVAVFGVLFNTYRTTKLERQRWKREDDQRERDRAAEADAAHARYEREDRTRYHLERVRAYSRFADAATTMVPGVPEPGVLGTVGTIAESLRIREFRAKRDEFHLSLFETIILGSEPVRAAALQLRDLVYEYMDKQLNTPREEHAALIERGGEAMTEFLEAARVELDITTPVPAANRSDAPDTPTDATERG
jgi:hypothetical protein